MDKAVIRLRPLSVGLHINFGVLISRVGEWVNSILIKYISWVSKKTNIGKDDNPGFFYLEKA